MITIPNVRPSEAVINKLKTLNKGVHSLAFSCGKDAICTYLDQVARHLRDLRAWADPLAVSDATRHGSRMKFRVPKELKVQAAIPQPTTNSSTCSTLQTSTAAPRGDQSKSTNES